MRFENPEVRHDVNVSPARPVRDFLAIAFGIAAVAGIATVVLYVAIGPIAARVPFSTEARVAAGIVDETPDPTGRQDALRALAARLVPHMDLPAGMTVRIHYRDAPTVNALATLGGNIIVFRGLLERMPHENALAMVLAHEIAHVRHRDPVVAAGRGMALAVVLGALSAGVGERVAGAMAGGTARVGAMRFGRAMESAADETALAAVVALYGHTAGAADTFRALQEEARARGRADPPAILATHPLGEARIARLGEVARARGWSTTGPLTPLAAPLAIDRPR